MTKLLFTTLPTNDLGLLTRSLPVARELMNRGHTISFCNPAKAPRRMIAEAGIQNYLPDESQVVYRSKDGKNEKTFDAPEWLSAMCSHVPNKGEQMVRYYGYYSNVSRSKRKKQDQDEWIPCILEPDKDSKEYRKNWARLLQKIYEVDPLTCPKCSGKMKIISLIEDEEIIKKILKHLALWEVKPRPLPKATGPPKTPEYHIDYSTSQLPVLDKWLDVDPEYPETLPPWFLNGEASQGIIMPSLRGFCTPECRNPLFMRMRYARRGRQPCPQLTHTGDE